MKYLGEIPRSGENLTRLELRRVRADDYADSIASESLADLVCWRVAGDAGVAKSTTLVGIEGERFGLHENSSLQVDGLRVVAVVHDFLESLSSNGKSCKDVRSRREARK